MRIYLHPGWFGLFKTVLLLTAGCMLFMACHGPEPLSEQRQVRGDAAVSTSDRQKESVEPDEIEVGDLPPEAQHVLQLIKAGGPFPYAKDGAVFGNREGILPPEPRGYYREYTVETPGARYRGARRIISGKRGDYYYTDDHYRSFKRIREK